MLRDYILDGHICHIEEGTKLKLGDVRLYPLLFEFNGKKCQAQRLLRRGKIRKQDQQSLTPYFFRDRETRKLVSHWLTTRVCKKTESILEEGRVADQSTTLLNSYALQEMFPNNNKIGVKGTQNIVNSHLVTQNLHKVHLGEKLPMLPKLARKRCIHPLVLDTHCALPLLRALPTGLPVRPEAAHSSPPSPPAEPFVASGSSSWRPPFALPRGLPARPEAAHSLPPSLPPSPSATLRRSGLASLRLSSPSSPPLKGLLSSCGPGVSWACACNQKAIPCCDRSETRRDSKCGARRLRLRHRRRGVASAAFSLRHRRRLMLKTRDAQINADAARAAGRGGPRSERADRRCAD